MSHETYMLDTNICSFIMRKRPPSVLEKMSQVVSTQSRIVVSAITYSELRFGAIHPKASPKIGPMVDAFIQRLDGVLPWDAAAVDQTAIIRSELGRAGTSIGHNDSAIAGHALATGCVLVTNNLREFERIRCFGVLVVDWVES
jgi:tRNA(fMet)-specific endonuclease VapC